MERWVSSTDVRKFIRFGDCLAHVSCQPLDCLHLPPPWQCYLAVDKQQLPTTPAVFDSGKELILRDRQYDIILARELNINLELPIVGPIRAYVPVA